MTIPDNTGGMMIPYRKYSVGHFDIFQNEYSGAWDFMYIILVQR